MTPEQQRKRAFDKAVEDFKASLGRPPNGRELDAIEAERQRMFPPPIKPGLTTEERDRMRRWAEQAARPNCTDKRRRKLEARIRRLVERAGVTP